MPLKWKSCGDGRYEARASRAVGGKYGKYCIEWVESFDLDGQNLARGCFIVYLNLTGGRMGVGHSRTLEQAQALAERHQHNRKTLGHSGDLPGAVDTLGSARSPSFHK
jgi:hypothetical protein